MIRLHTPFLDKQEAAAVSSGITQGHIGSNGPICHRVEQSLKALLSVKHVLLTSSCTAALHMSVMAYQLYKKTRLDQHSICVPDYTFYSTAQAALLEHIVPTLVDVTHKHHTIDPKHLEHQLQQNQNISIVIPVHYAGYPCDMSQMQRLKSTYNIFLIEDAAHALGSRYRTAMCGTLGDIGCLSFDQTKIITCGTGGAVCTNNTRIARILDLLREKGTNRAAYLHGRTKRYGLRSRGNNYCLSDINAAILEVQLRKLPHIVKRRTAIACYYNQELQNLEGLTLPPSADNVTLNWSIYPLKIKKHRNAFINYMSAQGIQTDIHFTPLSKTTLLATHQPHSFPGSHRVYRQLVRIPIHPSLTDAQVEQVAKSIKDYFGKS